MFVRNQFSLLSFLFRPNTTTTTNHTHTQHKLPSAAICGSCTHDTHTFIHPHTLTYIHTHTHIHTHLYYLPFCFVEPQSSVIHIHSVKHTHALYTYIECNSTHTHTHTSEGRLRCVVFLIVRLIRLRQQESRHNTRSQLYQYMCDPLLCVCVCAECEYVCVCGNTAGRIKLQLNCIFVCIVRAKCGVFKRDTQRQLAQTESRANYLRQKHTRENISFCEFGMWKA